MSACIWLMISWIQTSWPNVTHCIRVKLGPTQTFQLVIWVMFLPRAKATIRRDINLQSKDNLQIIWRILLRLVVSYEISKMQTKFTIIGFQEDNRVHSPKSLEFKLQSMANIPVDVKMLIIHRWIPRLLYHFQPPISLAAKINRVQNNSSSMRKTRLFLRWATHPNGPIINQH